MKTFFSLALALLLLQGCRNPTGDLAPQNPLLTPATPTPVACAPGPKVWDDFSSGSALNTFVPWGDVGTTISGSIDTGIFSGTPNSLHLTPKPGGYGCGMNILATNGAVLNAWCKTLFKFEIRTSVAATYNVRFKEGGTTGADRENWASPMQSSPAGTTFLTVAIPIASFTEDAYGDPACSGACAAPGTGNSTIELTAVTRFEMLFTAPTGAPFDVYVDNIRFE